MKFAPLLVLVFVGCAAPMPPATPPLPTSPPPPPPRREVRAAAVTGQVLDARGQPVAHSWVFVKAADASCRPIGPEVGALTDERGEFFAVSEIEPGPATIGCIVAEARSGGATGAASAPAYFDPPGGQRTPVRVEVRLDRPQPLTSADAERLVRMLADAINNPASGAPAELSEYVAQGSEALRVALDQYRTILGRVTSVQRVDYYDPNVLRFELRNASGRTATVDVHQEALRRIHSPLLDYGIRSERFINAYLRAISSGDAEMLARILNPDDIDFPVERAREMVIAYRQRYRDTASIRPEFVGLDERRNVIIWRLRGPGPTGEEVTETIELGFGDGLIGVSGL